MLTLTFLSIYTLPCRSPSAFVVVVVVVVVAVVVVVVVILFLLLLLLHRLPLRFLLLRFSHYSSPLPLLPSPLSVLSDTLPSQPHGIIGKLWHSHQQTWNYGAADVQVDEKHTL